MYQFDFPIKISPNHKDPNDRHFLLKFQFHNRFEQETLLINFPKYLFDFLLLYLFDTINFMKIVKIIERQRFSCVPEGKTK
jgi:hypothetical protein